MSKLLSVIVPVYNVEEYLPKCIESILEQTYTNLELILVNDGSTDDSLNICNQYLKKDSRITVLNQKNAGQGAARNKGIDIAKGDYIAFIDSDDYIEPNMYEVMIEALERTESDLSLCGYFTHSQLRIINSVVPENELIFENSEELLRAYFTTPFIGGGPWNKVFRKKIFKTLRFPEGTAREDIYVMHYLLGECSKAVHTSHLLYHYIIREGSSEHRDFNPKFLISIDIADDRYNYICKNYPALADTAKISVYGARISAIKKIVRSDAVKQYRHIYEELRDYLRANPAPSKKYQKLRILILYFPVIYKFKMDMEHKYRKKIKCFILKIIGNKK